MAFEETTEDPNRKSTRRCPGLGKGGGGMDCRPSLQRTGKRKLSLGLGDSQAHLPLKQLRNKLAPPVKAQGEHGQLRWQQS